MVMLSPSRRINKYRMDARQFLIEKGAFIPVSRSLFVYSFFTYFGSVIAKSKPWSNHQQHLTRIRSSTRRGESLSLVFFK